MGTGKPRKMGFYYLLIAIILMHLMLSCHGTEYRFPVKAEKKKYCGKILSDTLGTLCQGNYQEYYRIPKPYPLQNRAKSTSLLGRLQITGGVYEECCARACTKEILQSYCGGSGSR
ncbi:bombyxin B-8-like [Rhynchophorus ferrugineus]|uniref:LIRP-like protein n=1 Tax=Rhynchophorus ferrugineus TaxID=354439 RepID=A0A5Q0TX30_RHYFE|nr:hypothetical protein GWI33_006197 [Rhynchophorus ferrugineus]QGA72558.1 LIRP-like protein [Rhynchophorus ferrugineus]